MDSRKVQILNAIISSYIDLPIPVGSRTLSKEFDLGVSSATIRNEMADLEDLGYLNKPHQSAGRIPSDKAFRFYVDELSSHLLWDDNSPLAQELKERLQESRNISELFTDATHLLAQTTNCMAYLIAPRKPDTEIKRVNLIALGDATILLLIIGNKGIVEKHLLNIDKFISEEELALVESKLNEELSGLDFDKIEGLKIMLSGQMIAYSDFISQVIKRASKFNHRISSVEVYYDGITNVLNFEEYRDLDKARELMTFLEDKQSLFEMLNRNHSSADLEVVIGCENDAPIMQGNSLIRSVYRPRAYLEGSLGIIGPVRMDYNRLIQHVKLFSDTVAALIDEL